MIDSMELCNIATEIARGAGQILLQGRNEGFGDIDTKTSAVDVVTETDKRSEAFITEAILERRPDDGLLGEEGTFKESTTGVRWVIDPLDGTVNFVYGMPLFAVSIGAEVDGVPVAGAVFNPAMDELFSAASGKGAFLNDQPIACSTQHNTNLAMLGTGFSYGAEQRLAEGNWLAPMLGEFRDIRRTGSAALDMCFLAAGRIDVYAQSFVKDWDVCAGIAIATEAGAKVLREPTTGPNRNIVGANPELFDAALKVVSPLPDGR